MIFDLAKKKPWLREECGWIMYRCIFDLAAQKLDTKYVESILDQLCANDLARTPEGVAIWLAAKDSFPKAKFPQNVWKYEDPLDSRDKSTLAKIMKESSDVEAQSEGSGTKQSGVWNSKLHFAWDAVLSRIFASPQKKEKSKDKTSKSSRTSFVDFWVEVVDSEYNWSNKMHS